MLHYGVTVYIKDRHIQVRDFAHSGAQARFKIAKKLQKLTGLTANDCYSYIDNGTRVQLSMEVNKKTNMYDVVGRWSGSERVKDAVIVSADALKINKTTKKYNETSVQLSLRLSDEDSIDTTYEVYQCPTCAKVLSDEDSICEDCHQIAVLA